MTLQPFEGKPVVATTVAIRKAGDGLSAALKVAPEELHHGEKVFVVLECEVEKIRFDPAKDSDGFVRVHMLATEGATLVDEALVTEHLAAMKKRIREAAGEFELPLDGAQDPQGDPLEAFEGLAVCVCAHSKPEHPPTADRPQGGPCLACAGDPEPCPEFEPAVAEVPVDA